MDDESLNLIFGFIFLILIINTTILMSVASSVNGQNSLPRLNMAGNIPDPSSAVPQKSVVDPVANLQPLKNRTDGLTDSRILVPPPGSITQAQVPSRQPPTNMAAVLTDSKLIVTSPGSNLQVTGQQPPTNRATVLADSPIIVTPPAASESGQSIASYISIETPEPHEINMRPTLQPRISRTVFDGLVNVYTLTNENFPTDFPRISLKLAKPPLVIDYTVSPLNSLDIKYVEHKEIRTMHKENISIYRTYENSWFMVIVRNKDTGETVGEDGFGRGYSINNPRQLVIRTCGNFSVEFEGEDVTVNLTMSVPEGGLIP
jgi:hypothetical protein